MGNFYFGGQKVCPVVKITDYQPVISSLNITPTTSAQTISAPSGTDGYSPITVSAVTASIDNNIVAGNIKSGVSILGVAGNVTQLVGETRSVSITSTSGNTFTPTNGKNGITSITVTPTNQAKTITPTTSQQTISVPSGYSGFGTLTVNAVTSSIDANITAGNIKSGVSILGVNGSVTPLNGTTLSVTPTTSAQSLSPSSPYNGYTSVSVSAVTSSIDANITAGNIKSGVSILGVSGSLTPLVGETRSVSITSTAGNTFTPTSGKNGITSITVTPTNQAKTITPTTSSQSISVPSGYSGFGTLTVNAVTSSIDANITAGNIKDGVSILGVTGTYAGSGGYSEFPSYQVSSGVASKRSGALTGTEFSNITSISSDGLTNAFYGCSGLTGTVNLSSLTTVDSYGLMSAFFNCSGLTGLNLSSLTSVGRTGLQNAFYQCSGLTGTLDLSSLTTVDYNGLNTAFYNCSKLTGVDLSSLTTIDDNGLSSAFQGCSLLASVNLSSLISVGTNGLNYGFYNCSGLTGTVNLTSLTNIGSNGFSYAFRGCKGLTDIYFNSLTTASFGSYTSQFNNMLSSTGSTTTHTLHFPSNLSSKISTLTGYPTFGGTSGYVTLSFDLPATS